MKICPFKDRTIDMLKPVRVYRNLNKPGVVWSVQQRGRVVAYATDLTLRFCVCVVQCKALERVRRNKVREVHAWVEGYITLATVQGNIAMSYNPYKCNHFYNVKTGERIDQAEYMRFTEKGVQVL